MVGEAGGLEWLKTKDVRIKKRGDVYWARFSLRGQRIQKSLETGSFAIAVRLVDDIQNSILLGLNWQGKKELFCEAWPDFLEDKVSGVKNKKAVRSRTIKEYINFGERYFVPFFGDYALEKINEEVWEEYIQAVKERGAVKMFNHRKYFGSFMRWCFRKGKIKELPEFHNPDKPDLEGVGKAFTEDQIKDLRKASPMPFKLAIYMATCMGMRSSEITQLAKSRILLEKRIIALRPEDTKIGKGRRIPIHKAVLGLLAAQIEASGKSPYLFPNRDDKKRPMDKTGFKKPWAKVKEEVGVEGRFHDLRHTYLSTIVKRPNVPHLLICEAAGLSIKTLQRVYLHLTDEDLLTVPDLLGGDNDE